MEEISPENSAALESRYRTARIIISAQIALTMILIVSVWFFVPPANYQTSPQTLTTLRVLILFLAVGAFVLRRTFFRWERLKDITRLKGIAGLLKTLQKTAVILAFQAMLLAGIGCLITVLTGETFEMLRAGIVALIVFLINFPRRTVWKKIVAGMEKV